MPGEALGDQAQLRRPRLRALWPSAVGWADQVEGARQRVGGALWQGERRKVELFNWRLNSTFFEYGPWRTTVPKCVCWLTLIQLVESKATRTVHLSRDLKPAKSQFTIDISAAHSYHFCPFNLSFYLKLWPTQNSGFIFGSCNISSSAICGKARLLSTWKRDGKMSTLWWVTFENLCWDTLSYGFGPSRSLRSSVNAHIVWTNRRQSG